MVLLVEFLLGLVLLTPFVDAYIYYTVKGEFQCHGQPTLVKIRIIEHDPNENDIVEFHTVNSILNYTGFDEDFMFWPDDPLELSIHALFDCDCEEELYQYIDPFFQRHVQDKENPMILGLVELSDVCKNGEVKAKYSDSDNLNQRRQWTWGRYDEVDIRGHFKEIN